MENNKISIYSLRHPESNEVVYIGKAKNPNLRRNSYNCLKANINGKRPVQKWVTNILLTGIKPVFEIIEVCDIINWEERECYWIAHFKSTGISLLNVSSGGKGRNGTTHSEESKKLISLSKTGKPKKGKSIYLEINGEPIKIFESLTDASDFSGTSIKSISNNLLGISTKTKIGKWKFY